MNRDKFRFIKTHKIMTFVVAAILTLTIGYAIFSESIDILGLASTGSSNFNIVFDRVGQIEEHEATGTSANIVDAGKKLEIRVEHLKMPSSYVEIPVVVKNKGDITAKVKEIKTSGLDTTDIKVTYEGLLLEDVLNPNDERNLKITVTWDMSSVNPNVVADFTIEIVYEQVVNGSVTTSAPTEIVDNRFIYEGTKLMGLSAEGEEYFKQSENKELIIPEGTTEIADGAFFVPYGYEGEIPDFLFFESHLVDYILDNLTNEEKLKFEKENELFSAISDYDIQNSRLKDYTVKFPNSLISIGRGSFVSLMLTGDLIIPNSVKEIGSMAFSANGFNGILKLSNSLSKIDIQAFAGNQFSGGLTIPDSVESIEFNAFYSSGFSSNLVLSKNLKKIDMMAFAGNKFNGELYIPDSVNQIGLSAFNESEFSSISISSKTIYEETSFPSGIPINIR